MKARVILLTSVLEEVEHEAERMHPNETGGVLLGYADREDPGYLEICKCVGPGPCADYAPRRFDPDTDWQAARVAEEYERSGHVVTYLGDWHSHPTGSTNPSSLDRTTARAIARHDEARLPSPLMLILGGPPGRWTPVVYRYRWNWLWQAQLQIPVPHG